MLKYQEYCEHYGLDPESDLSYRWWNEYLENGFDPFPTWAKVLLIAVFVIAVIGLVMYPAVP